MLPPVLLVGWWEMERGRRKKESDLSSLEDLMNEHSFLPPQIDLMNMGYPSLH